MKKHIWLIALAALILIPTALSASSDQGKRLAGPFCVGKPSLLPVFVHGTKVIRAGAVRSVSVSEKCQGTELRKFGQPDNDEATEGGAIGPQGPKGDTGAQGPAGKDGQSIVGPEGPAGKDGADGKDGTNGLGDIIVYACVSNGGAVQFNVNGQPCGENQGHTQIKLVGVSD